MSTILITGATGLIGQRLTQLLLQRGHVVKHLGRSRRSSEVPAYVWNIEKREIDPRALQGTDVIVNLAGANVGDKPWTEQRKREILESRTQATQLLHDQLKHGDAHAVKTFVNASAIGYYGFDDPNATFTEHDAPGKDFLAYVTQRWEKEADAIGTLGIRLVKMRIGIVLSKEGGSLKELMKPMRFFVGAPLGTGTQYLSWIHIDDACGIIVKAIEDNTMQGPYNVVAPNPVTNRAFTEALAQAMHKPLWLPPIPAFALKWLLGEMADLVLRGNKVSAQKILQAGYTFHHTTLQSALANLLKN